MEDAARDATASKLAALLGNLKFISQWKKDSHVECLQNKPTKCTLGTNGKNGETKHKVKEVANEPCSK